MDNPTEIKNARIVELQFVDIELIVKTNETLDEAKIMKMIEDDIKPQDTWAICPAYRLPGGMQFMVTDGNHRIEALRRRGFRWMPIAELTKPEFDYVKFSKTRTTNIAIKLVDHPRYWIKLSSGGFSSVKQEEIAKYL